MKALMSRQAKEVIRDKAGRKKLREIISEFKREPTLMTLSNGKQYLVTIVEKKYEL